MKRISAQASARAVTVLKDFSRTIEDWQVKRVVAVATGVVRKAANRNGFLKEIFEETGLRVSAISGEKEARLTSKGALGALGIKNPPFFVFDLGGGTTEFLLSLFPGHGKEGRVVDSVSLGAMMLTNAFLLSDPPAEAVVARLLRHLKVSELLVSMSDLLEGALMDFLEGEQHG